MRVVRQRYIMYAKPVVFCTNVFYFHASRFICRGSSA